MRLKKLILHGFKSFADRTEFVFDSPITGIVGPNGCGKSNVVDALKWVLGEQSAKSLRGDAMMDVIFNGAEGRKPAGLAEVVMIFDNPRRDDGMRVLNLDTDEVTVGRRLFRDGTSEYQLNNQASRLRDIRELFLDTGIGVDAYSVIEQGRVSALLEANPAERRLIFEEAAGISKYKAKKKEAQRKLERVDQNLLRVTDIVEEVDKRLRSVRIQAGRARTFQEYSTRLRELRLTYALQEYHTQREQLKALEAKCEDAQFRLDDANGDLARKQNELAAKREQSQMLNQKKQQVEYELVGARAAMQSAQQRQQYARQQLEQIGQQLGTFEQDKASLEQKLCDGTASLDNEQRNLARLTDDLEKCRQQIETKQQAFRDGQLGLNELNQEIEAHKTAILDLMRRLAAVGSRLGAIEIERKNIAGQQQRLGQRRQVVAGELEALEAQKAEAQSKLDSIGEKIASHQAQLEAKRGEAAALGRQIAEVSEQLAAAREHRSGLVSRQNLLKDLEERREGVSEGVKSILARRNQEFAFVRGLVADVLHVDVEHAHIIEAALDGRDQHLVTDDSAATVAAEEKLAELEGRVNFLCSDRLPAFTDGYDWSQHPHKVRAALDLVRFDAADAPLARHLLGRTVVVDDLKTAAELQQGAGTGYRYVTISGEVIEADGTVRAGPLAAAMGLISRRSELVAIAGQIADVDARIAQLSGQLNQDSAQAKALEESQNALRNSAYQLNTQKVELGSLLAQHGDKENSLTRERAILDRELQQFMDQTARLGTEQQQLAAQRDALEGDQASRQRRVEQHTSRQQQLGDELKALGEQLTQLRVELGQVQEKQLASQQQVQRQTAAQAELDQQIQRIADSLEQLTGRRAQVQDELTKAQAEETGLLDRQQSLAQQVEELSQKATEAGAAVQALTSAVDQARETAAAIEQTLHQAQLQLGEIRVRVEGLVQRTREELELDVVAKYEELAASGGYQPAEMDWDAVANEIKELRDKIHRLGNVNLDAIGEMDELEQRQAFLSKQVTDLTDSKKQLEQMIDEINKESGIRFEQTFNAVREHFQGMFRKLFGGGKADIFLETSVDDSSEFPVPSSELEVGKPGTRNSELGTNESVLRKTIDPLEAGIEIIAKPPGKQPVSISQLSGGEKTMTCVALLMSIFKSKPSPFCILDEVDAALDEANNQRFNLIVQEFLAQSQFIIITHSKRTMQIADVLYGVTMQEQGVSKRVAVKFEQVDAQGRFRHEELAAENQPETAAA